MCRQRKKLLRLVSFGLVLIGTLCESSILPRSFPIVLSVVVFFNPSPIVLPPPNLLPRVWLVKRIAGSPGRVYLVKFLRV